MNSPQEPKKWRELVPLVMGRQKTKETTTRFNLQGYTPNHSPGPLNCEILCDGLPDRHATKCSSVQQALWLLPSMLSPILQSPLISSSLLWYGGGVDLSSRNNKSM